MENFSHLTIPPPLVPKPQDLVEKTEEPIVSGEEIWNRLQERVQVEFRESVLSIVKKMYKDDPVKQERTMECFWEAERQFVTRVWDAVRSLADDGAERINVLFDIDDTIGNSDLPQDTPISRTVLRPSLYPLIETLRATLGEQTISFGLLTTRGRLTEQLEDPNHLKSIADFIDPQKCYSTRVYYQEWSEGQEYETWGRLGEYGTPQELQERCGAILNPSLDLATTPIAPIDSMKLVMLTRITQEDPNGAYVVVDDIDYPNLLRTDGNRVRGVGLQENETFSLSE